MSTLTVARNALTALLKKREKIEATSAEREMAEHLERRAALREELQAGHESEERSEHEHAENLAAYQAMGEKYSRDERDAIPEVREECKRLNALVNNWKPFRSGTAGEQLVASCLDTDLQERNRIASTNLQQAKRDLQDAKQQETKNWEAMAQSQRDLIETLGNVSYQFGREGQRWRKTENETGVWVESIDDAIHPENVKFLNGNLIRPNRVIREGRAKDFGIEKLAADIEAFTEQLAAIHAAMIASDI